MKKFDYENIFTILNNFDETQMARKVTFQRFAGGVFFFCPFLTPYFLGKTATLPGHNETQVPILKLFRMFQDYLRNKNSHESFPADDFFHTTTLLEWRFVQEENYQ